MGPDRVVWWSPLFYRFDPNTFQASADKKAVIKH